MGLAIIVAVVLFFAAIGVCGLIACGLGSLRGATRQVDLRYLKWGVGGAVSTILAFGACAVLAPGGDMVYGVPEIIVVLLLFPLFSAGISMTVLYMWEQYFS